MVAEARLFLRLGLLSVVGLGFYYAHLFFGMFGNAFLFRALAVVFLLTALPLPIIALNNKKLFPALHRPAKTLLTTAAVLLLVHHFLMTFLFVLLLPEGRVF